jgi:hypothetical protein
MRINKGLEKYRVRTGPWGSEFADPFGAFLWPSGMKVIASPGDAEVNWEHVSVSFPDRTPTWEEMCCIKDLFWKPEEPVMQLHPPKSDYVNNHAYCLHLWRPKGESIPLPPSVAVGYKELNIR